jgi:acyl-CoA thioesterase-1
MSLVIFIFGSGLAFFVGAGLVLLSLVTFYLSARRWLHSLALVTTITGVLLVGLSATPLPYWYYGILIGTTAVWLVFEEIPHDRQRRIRYGFRSLALVLWLVAIAVESPHHFTPTLASNGSSDLYIIGDSVSAGLGERDEVTWPRILAQRHPMKVHDFSHVGAKAASALKQARRLPPEDGIVLLEIGGNDVLGGTPAATFEQDLDRLLSEVSKPRREVLMFELPLPPLHNEFGHIQRRLAARHGVRLIPKRTFVSVLTAGGATLDSVHLSREGHEMMAEAVWQLVGPAMAQP